MSLKVKTIKGLAWTATQDWGSRIISLAIFACLARLLQPEAFGLIALSTVLMAFLQVFGSQGFTTALIQRKDLEEEHLDTAFWINLSLSTVLLLLGTSLSGVLATSYQEPQLAPIVRWLSLSFLVSAFTGVQQAQLVRSFRFKELAIRSLIAMAVAGAVGISMALYGLGVWSLVGYQLTNQLVGVLVLWQVSKWRPKARFSYRHGKELFSFGINITGSALLNFFNRHTDDILIGYYLGSVALGYYTVAYRILTILTQLMLGVMSKVALPLFSKLQSDSVKMRQAFYSGSQVASLVAFPICLGMFVAADKIIPLMFGDKWMPSVPVMRILVFIALLHTVQGVCGPVLISMNKPNWGLKVNFFNTIANVVSFVLVVRLGIVAVAVAYVVRGYVFFPIRLILVKKLIHIQYSTYLRRLLPAVSCTALMVGALLLLKFLVDGWVPSYVFLGLYGILGILVYGLTLYIFYPSIVQPLIKPASVFLTTGKIKL